MKTIKKIFSRLIVFILFFIMSFCVGLTSYAQKNKTQKNSESEKLKSLFIGIPNPVNIQIKGINSKRIALKVDNAEVVKDGDNYLVSIHEKGEVLLKISVDKKEIFAQKYNVRYIPDPIATIGKIYQGKIDKKELLKIGKISASFSFDPILTRNIPYKVTQFTLNAAMGKDYDAQGENFTKEQIAYINNLSSGSQVSFSSIKAKGPDGINRNLSPIVLMIK